MLVIISPAKTFATRGKRPLPSAPYETEPRLVSLAQPIIETAMLMDDREMQRELMLSPKLSATARLDWNAFVSGEGRSGCAAELYSGMVFRQLGASQFTPEQWQYAEEHLCICSFVYGLLRPTDVIRPYRMEGTVRLASGQRIFDYWRDILTPRLIERGKLLGGTLIYLASEEMKQLFHWEQVEQALRVISPTFLVRQPSGVLRQIVIYTKMARGQMTRSILTDRITDPEVLQTLTPQGFAYHGVGDEAGQWIYTLE